MLREKLKPYPPQGNNPSTLMKKERFSFFILFFEIAAIVFLHSAKNRDTERKNTASNRKANITASAQFKTLSLTKVK